MKGRETFNVQKSILVLFSLRLLARPTIRSVYGGQIDHSVFLGPTRPLPYNYFRMKFCLRAFLSVFSFFSFFKLLWAF